MISVKKTHPKPHSVLGYYHLYNNHYYMATLEAVATISDHEHFPYPSPPLFFLSQSTDGYLIISDHGLMKQKILLRWNLFWGSNQHFTNYTHPLSSNERSLASGTGLNLAGWLAGWLACFLLQ